MKTKLLYCLSALGGLVAGLIVLTVTLPEPKVHAQVDLYPEWRGGREHVGILDTVKTVNFSSPLGHTNFALSVTTEGSGQLTISSVTDSNFVATVVVPFDGAVHYLAIVSR